jgi:Uma2 family endonuclease
MMRAATQVNYTAQQYLDLERAAEHKSEYINGRIYAVAGASRQHNQITFNIAGELRSQLKDRPCLAYASDMRVKISATGLYTYPDIVALCQDPQFEDTGMDTLINPEVIVEVLSESTEAYDRGEKFAHYRRLPSVSEYLLIAQDQTRVEHYLRQDKQWLLTEFDALNDGVALNTIACHLSLAEIYDKVVFSGPAES